jgi:CRISPR/Cas system-associated endonuclease Cas1
VPVLEQTIQELEQEKQNNANALQVRRQLASIPAGHEMDHVLKYEGAIERQFYKAIDQLERLQRLRAGDQVPAPVKIDVTVDAERTD